MATVTEGLDGVRRELDRLDRGVVHLFEPGLDPAAVRARLQDAPDEVVEWFAWADGTRAEEDQTVDEASFIPGYVLISLDEAVEFRDEVEVESDGDEEWLPLLVSPAGDFYAVAWTADEGVVQVWSYVDGASDQTDYPDMERMLRTFVESYRTGAFEVDDEGFLDMHPELADRVYEAVNRAS
ncbi:hypothetical protein [Yinghuangia seranimata]|uniref:hypothetical protein n=1 Tax=Yinghuangia seranimata TaxID=408067 RepID=UPI00248C5300|nr:hypothetical protein [Yinghuangia seranimata]MDI2132678.1 hypothetical protein [Yinghuangia seranimata]